jgi:hypothetical protein
MTTRNIDKIPTDTIPKGAERIIRRKRAAEQLAKSPYEPFEDARQVKKLRTAKYSVQVKELRKRGLNETADMINYIANVKDRYKLHKQGTKLSMFAIPYDVYDLPNDDVITFGSEASKKLFDPKIHRTYLNNEIPSYFFLDKKAKETPDDPSTQNSAQTSIKKLMDSDSMKFTNYSPSLLLLQNRPSVNNNNKPEEDEAYKNYAKEIADERQKNEERLAARDLIESQVPRAPLPKQASGDQDPNAATGPTQVLF